MSRAYIVTRNGGTVTKAPINDNKIPIYANETAMKADLANIGENVICMANGFFYLVKTVGGVKTTTQLTDKGYGLPLGTIIAYEGSVPDGFLACDGSAYNTTTYSALYALLGVGTTPNLTSQNMNNTDGWCIKATPAYVEPDTVSDMVNTLRTQDSYSLEEVNTGKKWIDGKPIYRRTFEVYKNNVLNGWTRSGCSFIYQGNDLSIDELISNSAITSHGLLTNWVNGTSGMDFSYGINHFVSGSNHKWTMINAGNDEFSGTKCILTIEYTKTTD